MSQKQIDTLEQITPINTKTKGTRIHTSHLRRIRRHAIRVHLSQDQKRDGQGTLSHGKKVPTNIRTSKPASRVYRDMRQNADVQLAFMD